MAPPFGVWPVFTFQGVLRDTEGSPSIIRRAGAPEGRMGEECMFYDEEADEYVLLAHSTNETYCSRKPADGDYLNGWQNAVGTLPLVQPRGEPGIGPISEHTDTPFYLGQKNGLHLIVNNCRPGLRHIRWPGYGSTSGGVDSVMSVATSPNAPQPGVPFTQSANQYVISSEPQPEYTAEPNWMMAWEVSPPEPPEPGQIRGGISECSGFIHPVTGAVRIFFRALHRTIPGPEVRRISYADSPDGHTPGSFVVNPIPFWDALVDGSLAAFYASVFRLGETLQPTFILDPYTGGVHGIIKISGHGGGASVPKFGHLIHIYNPSPGGDDPNLWERNPLGPGPLGSWYWGLPTGAVAPETFRFQRTPGMFIDTKFQRYVLHWNGGAEDPQPGQSTPVPRYTYVATAPYPDPPPMPPPPMQISRLALPTVARAHTVDESVIDQSSPDGGAFHTKALAAGVHPKLYRVEWLNVPRATLEMIRAHHLQHSTGVAGTREFEWTPPWAADPVPVSWAQRPRYSARSATHYDIEGVFARNLASDVGVFQITPDEVNLEADGSPVEADAEPLTYTVNPDAPPVPGL